MMLPGFSENAMILLMLETHGAGSVYPEDLPPVLSAHFLSF